MNSFDGYAWLGDMLLLTSWLYFRKPWNQFSTSLKSTSCDLLLAMLALDDERSLFTISRTEPRRPEENERDERDSSLLLRVGSGARNPLAVGGLESLSGDVDRRDSGRRIQDGDSLSRLEGVSGDMMRSDMERAGKAIECMIWCRVSSRFLFCQGGEASLQCENQFAGSGQLGFQKSHSDSLSFL